MEAKAHLKYLRISPRKVKILCDLIRGKDAKTACVYMMQTPTPAPPSSVVCREPRADTIGFLREPLTSPSV